MAWFTRKKHDAIEVQEPAVSYTSPMESLSPKQNYRAAGASRDAFIVGLIQRFGLLTSDLLQQRLSVEKFEGLTSQHNILNRLKILTKRREIYAIGRIASGHIVYGAKPLRGARRHVSHDLGVARFGITLECAAKELEDWCCDQSVLAQEFKSGERPFVPDARFILNGFQTYLEYHTGSQDERVIVEKTRAYKRHHESLKQLAKIDMATMTKIRVLFLCKRHEDVEKLLQIVTKAYQDSMLFWVAYEGIYVGAQRMVLSPIWNVGRTDAETLHFLLEASDQERPGV